MKKRLLEVGLCSMDHGVLSRYLAARFNVEVVQARVLDEALASLAKDRYDLVVVNRLLDEDGSEGLDVIRQIRADAALAKVPVMLVSNYADAQDAAVAAGAVRGFGKSEYERPETAATLRKFLA